MIIKPEDFNDFDTSKMTDLAAFVTDQLKKNNDLTEDLYKNDCSFLFYISHPDLKKLRGALNVNLGSHSMEIFIRDLNSFISEHFNGNPPIRIEIKEN